MTRSSLEEEEFELASKDVKEQTIRAQQDEQQQGLLGGWKDGDDESDDVSTDGIIIGRPSFRRQRLRVIGIAVLGAVVLAIAFTAAFVAVLRRAAFETVENAFSIRTNDYILDPEWDLDAPAQRREYSWVIRDQVHNPDGVYRPMILANNQFPGPLVEANQGDTIVVHVQNHAINATSIHWHGLYQNGTNHMDGTVGITQCPIPPDGEFTYEFTVDGQSGTYWWHAHQSAQSSDGLHGPLIIHSKDEKEMRRTHYDTDRVVLLADHYHELSSGLLWNYLKPDMENTEPSPQGALINGRTDVRNCDDFPHHKCDNSSAHLEMTPFDMSAGKSHRLRLINVGAFAEFQFQIDEHELAVTEVEGTDVLPMSYHRININPAQRYSVVVRTTVKSSRSFWMRARMITSCFTDPPATLRSDVQAILRYDSSNMQPQSKDWSEALQQECKDINTTELKPLGSMRAPEKEDYFFHLRSNFEIGAYRLSRGVFNSSSWRAGARSSTLLRAVDELDRGNASFNPPDDRKAFVNEAAFDKSKELVLQTSGVQVIDVLVSNFDDGNHPLHLHGYKYFVLAQGHGYPPHSSAEEELTRANLEPLYQSLDLTNPLRRDTASVEAFGWILLRFIADNPGAWAFHCHVSWHTEAGLLMQFLTRADRLKGMDIPEAHRGLCAAEGVEKGMGPEDEDYRDLAK